jgi:hypothetical protein
LFLLLFQHFVSTPFISNTQAATGNFLLSDCPGPTAPRDNDTISTAFRFWGQRQRPEVYNIFRGSIARPAHPLSTLRPYPYGYTRMTRGRCGSLLLHRMELSSITPYRFSRCTPNILYPNPFSILKTFSVTYYHNGHQSGSRNYQQYCLYVTLKFV